MEITMNSHEFKVWRMAMNFTQDAAADALGISKPTVVNYESGKRREDNRIVEIPSWVGLACAALYHRLDAWELSTPGKAAVKEAEKAEKAAAFIRQKAAFDVVFPKAE
jgi:transcriptional regulator with XRE-family HTH domain